MSYYSLVHKNTNRVVQIISSNDERFEVNEELSWVQGPSEIDGNTEAPDYYYDNESHSIKRRSIPPQDYDALRKQAYPSIFEQLEMLWNDMNLDLVPGKDGSWFKSIQEIKDKYPKPNS